MTKQSRKNKEYVYELIYTFFSIEKSLGIFKTRAAAERAMYDDIDDTPKSIYTDYYEINKRPIYEQKGSVQMTLFEKELNQIFEIAETEEKLNNFFDHVATAGMFTKPSLLYILKCQLAVDPNLENEIREAWKASKVKEESE